LFGMQPSVSTTGKKGNSAIEYLHGRRLTLPAFEINQETTTATESNSEGVTSQDMEFFADVLFDMVTYGSSLQGNHFSSNR
jgi:hypothetical protein